MVTMRERFIPTNNDLSYYPLLYKALEATKGDIIEMGTGHGSTPLLHDYATLNKRTLLSYETEREWLIKFEETANDYHKFYHLCRECWDVCSKMNQSPSVVFIDHAPGERRKVDLVLFAHKAEIVVIHDTEPTGAGDYRVRELFGHYKYVVEVATTGAWATALSNKIDLTGWAGEWFGQYLIVGHQK